MSGWIKTVWDFAGRMSLIFGVILISYQGWWIVPGSFFCGWFVSWLRDNDV